MSIKRKILSFADFKKGKNSLEKPEKHLIKENINNSFISIQDLFGETPTASELAEYCYDNYDKVTGDPKEERDEEMDFHPEIYKLINDFGIQIDEFQDAWTDYANESLTEKEMKEMETEVEKGKVYKVFDKEKNGAMVYSAAKYEGDDSKGSKFALINRPTESFVWITKDEMKHMLFTPSNYKPKE